VPKKPKKIAHGAVFGDEKDSFILILSPLGKNSILSHKSLGKIIKIKRIVGKSNCPFAYFLARRELNGT
jgi:hypothetical protein